MGFEKKEGKIAIRAIPRESERKPRSVDTSDKETEEESLEGFFEYKTGDNQVLKDMLKSLMLILSTQDFETFCDITPDKEALLNDFNERKTNAENPQQYAFISYAMEVLRDHNQEQ